MSSKKTRTWPVSTRPNTPGGESKSDFLFLFFFSGRISELLLKSLSFFSHFCISLQVRINLASSSPYYVVKGGLGKSS